MSKKSIIDYEQLVQSALRQVVHDALMVISKNTLRASHHFYISFATDHPGVDIPDYLREQYPEEITIVLQHEFWDLVVEKDSFSVTLCFNDINERLTVPFSALVSFVDPSVKFGLQFIPEFESEEVTSNTFKQNKNISVISEADAASSSSSKSEGDNIISLDFFRKK